jgi:hypothetical protein
MVFELSANKLLGLEPSRSKVLRKSFFDFVRGLISFPLYLPGTAYYACMQVINLTTVLFFPAHYQSAQVVDEGKFGITFRDG